MKTSVMNHINKSANPVTLRVKENGRTFIVKNIVKIEEDFVQYPKTIDRMATRRDYKFWYSDGMWQHFRNPTVTLA